MPKINLARISPLAVFLNGLLGVPFAQSSLPLPNAGIFFAAISAGCTLLYAFTLWLPGYLAPKWLPSASVLPLGASAAFYLLADRELNPSIAFGQTAAYLCLILFCLGTLLPTLLVLAGRWRFSRKPRNRGKQALLALVRAEISARGEQSLLAVAPSPGELQRLWDVELKIGKQPSHKLGQGQKIWEYFAGNSAGHLAGVELSGTVLVLGGRGAGKTTTLLELASDLCDRRAIDPSARVPALLDLGSWKPSQPLERWLLRSLSSKYEVDLEIDELLPLLDGLDELNLKRQEQCLKAIERLRRDFGSLPLVVCTSFDRYKRCQTRLRLQGAIGLRPLTKTQIKDYLFAARSRELWHDIEDDPGLLDVAKVPLFLNAIALADEEILIHAWKRLKDRKSRERYVLNAWVRRQLASKLGRPWYPPDREPSSEQTRHWLSWLANTMQKRSLREIAIENLPPVTRQLSPQQLGYPSAMVLSIALAYSLCFGWLYGLNYGAIYSIVFVGASLLSGMGIALRSRTLDSRSLGNQTLWLSGIRAVAFSLLGLLSFAVFGGMENSPTSNAAMENAIATAGYSLELASLAKSLLPILGLVAALAAAIPGMQSLTLRLILLHQGNIPWNYSRFLHYATAKKFLQKVGNRYRFAHYLIQEHFAQLVTQQKR